MPVASDELAGLSLNTSDYLEPVSHWGAGASASQLALQSCANDGDSLDQVSQAARESLSPFCGFVTSSFQGFFKEIGRARQWLHSPFHSPESEMKGPEGACQSLAKALPLA